MGKVLILAFLLLVAGVVPPTAWNSGERRKPLI